MRLVFVKLLTMRSTIFFLVILLFRISQQKFVIPEISIQAIKPKGLVVSMKDVAGMQQFAFHGNVNNPIRGKEEGTISKQIGRAVDGIWQLKDDNVELKKGDVIYYWIFVQHNRLGFDKQEQTYTVVELFDKGSSPNFSSGPVEICPSSITTINNGKRTCGGTTIFEDNFDNIDENKWEKQVYIADKPDNEFVTYEKQNIIISNGVLNLKANIRPNVENIKTLDFTDSGCTGRSCKKTYTGILPQPVIAGQIKSKFAFKYGTIEIRAQLPKGDWVYPQLYLETSDNSRIWLAYSRGNSDLRTKDQKQIGNKILYSGPMLQGLEPQRSSAANVIEFQGSGTWSDDFHTFIFTWKPDDMTISVDGITMSTTNSVSLFGKEFAVTLGIAVGGASDFPDKSTSGSTPMPWVPTQYRPTTFFFEKKTSWLPTWQNEESVLKIDYIRIKAL